MPRHAGTRHTVTTGTSRPRGKSAAAKKRRKTARKVGRNPNPGTARKVGRR